MVTSAALTATTATQTTGTWTNPTNATGAENATFASWASTTSGASAALTLAGFGTFSDVPAGVTLNFVTVRVKGYTSVTGTTPISSVTSQLYNGSTAIGSAVTHTKSSTTTNVYATFNVTGVTLAQLQSGNLAVRHTIVRAASTTTATAFVDAVTLTADYTLPAVPSTPASLASSAVSSFSATLSWPASSGATGYSLRRSTDNATWSTIYTGSALTYTDNTLAPTTQYYYQVAATNAGGTSAYTTSTSVMTLAVPPRNFGTYTDADHFERADETPLSDGGGWFTNGTTTALHTVAGNVVTGAVGGSSAARRATPVSGLQVSEITVGPTITNYMGAAVAMTAFGVGVGYNGPGYYVLRTEPSNAIVLAQKVAASGSHTLLSSMTQAVVAGDRLRLEWDGVTLTAYLNDVLLPALTVTPATPIDPAQNYVGIAYGSTVANASAISSWRGGTYTPVITSVECWGSPIA